MSNYDKTLITAALPYANGKIHVGHLAGAYLPADIYHRYLVSKDLKSLFICGSDEYGIAITIKAEESKRTPKQQVDHFHEMNKALFEKMGIDFSHYSRTTLESHTKRVQEFFLEHFKNGYIEKRKIHQLYSPSEGRFLADRYVKGKCPKCGYEEARGDECTKCGASFEATDLINPVSKMSGSKLELKETEHYFFRFDLFKEKLKDWLETKSFKPSTMNFSRQYIEELKPRCITRDLDWGVPLPLPESTKKVLYVWYDAPIGYISATADLDPSLEETYWKNKSTRYVQFIGKDNTTFHSVLFPAMIMGQDKPYKLVDDLVVNEFLNLKGEKFSKSSGNSLDLDEMLSWLSPDQIRFYLAYIAPEHQDSDFSFEDLMTKVNSELVGKLGNFIHRTLKFTETHLKRIPQKKILNAQDEEFLEHLRQHLILGETAFENFSIKKGLELLLDMAQLSNRYFDHQKPWVLVKDSSSSDRLETVMWVCLEAVKALLIQMQPIMPFSAEKGWQFFGISTPPLRDRGMEIQIQKLENITPLFNKLETKPMQVDQTSAVETTALPQKAEIEFADFEKIELKVATVIACEAVAKSEKLLKFTLDVGGKTRTILSGIKNYFANPEDLVGKKVAIVANLKPRKMMGIESHGMILSVVEEGVCELVSFSSSPSGSDIR